MRRLGQFACAILAGVVLVAVSVALPSCSRGRAHNVIGVSQFATHPLLDSVYEGLLAGLKDAGLSQATGTEVVLRNANGDQTTAMQVSAQFVSQGVDMLIPIGTPSAQAAVKATTTIPVVFAAITDPVKAGIADSFERPGGNRTGTCDRWPYRKQVELIALLCPNARRVGIILNPGEANTEASMDQIRPVLRDLGLEEVDVAVSSTAEVYAAAQSLVKRCDVILVPSDNTVVSAFASVVKVANEARIPLFAGSTDCVKQGAIATYGVNYFEVGRATGALAAEILMKHLDPGLIPVVVESKTDLVVNLDAARAQGVTIPDSLVQQAAEVIGQKQD